MSLYDFVSYQEMDSSGNQQQRTVSDEILSFTPTTGTTVSPSYTLGRDTLIVLTPAGTLLALTISFPSAVLNPRKKIRFSSSQALTGLTLTPIAGSVVGTITTLALGGFGHFQSDGTNWLRIG